MVGRANVASRIYAFATLLTVTVVPVARGAATVSIGLQSNDTSREIQALMGILQDEQAHKDRSDLLLYAIERLGELRATAAIDHLVKLLTFRRTFKLEEVSGGRANKPVTPLGRYPAAGALAQIGKPALPALVKVIESNESGSDVSEAAIWTVREIFRPVPAERGMYLREAAAKASDTEGARRLRLAAKKEDDLLKRVLQH